MHVGEEAVVVLELVGRRKMSGLACQEEVVMEEEQEVLVVEEAVVVQVKRTVTGGLQGAGATLT